MKKQIILIILTMVGANAYVSAANECTPEQIQFTKGQTESSHNPGTLQAWIRSNAHRIKFTTKSPDNYITTSACKVSKEFKSKNLGLYNATKVNKAFNPNDDLINTLNASAAAAYAISGSEPTA